MSNIEHISKEEILVVGKLMNDEQATMKIPAFAQEDYYLNKKAEEANKTAKVIFESDGMAIAKHCEETWDSDTIIKQLEDEKCKFFAELKSVVDEIGGELSMSYNSDDMSYVVNYTRNGIPLKISLEALEAVCSTNGPGTLRETLLSATSPELMLKDQQNALICDLMNVSDAISKHTESKQDRAEKLKYIVQKIMPEKMESYFHLSEDMSEDMFGRFDKDDVYNVLITNIKYDLIQYIASM